MSTTRTLPACLQDEDDSIAVEACEFWTAFCESEVDKDALRPSLPRVLPVLLKNMVSCPPCSPACQLRGCMPAAGVLPRGSASSPPSGWPSLWAAHPACI